MKNFYWLWLGQLVSILASGITSFALGFWILEQTSSVTDFATVIVLATLPGTLLAPLAGVLIDRHSRKKIIILADVTAALTTALIAYLYWSGNLQIWHIYIVTAIDSMALAFQIPAVMAATTMLVPPELLGRASGLSHMSEALAGVAGPFLAGMLLVPIGLSGILVLDLVTFLFAAILLLFIPVPDPDKTELGPCEESSLRLEAKLGWHYIRERHGLIHLMIFAGLVNLIAGMVVVSVMPLAVSFADEAQVGFIMAAGGVGSLMGGAYLATTGGPARKINGVYAGTLLAACCLFVMGLQASLWFVAVGLFLFEASIPLFAGSAQVIWQTRVAAELQGRVFATRRILSQITVPVGSFGAGILADRLFEPVMREGGPLTASLGAVLGTGAGRGIGLMLIVLAGAMLATSLWAMANKHIRNIENEG